MSAPKIGRRIGRPRPSGTLHEAHTAAECLALRCAGLQTGLDVLLRDVQPERAQPIREQVAIMAALAGDLVEGLRAAAYPPGEDEGRG